VTAREDLYEKELQSIREIISPCELLVLPAKRRFKIQVILDPRLSHHMVLTASHHEQNPNILKVDTPSLVLSETEKEIVRQLQDNLSPATDPIKAIAKKTGLNPMEIVQLLLRWKETGVLRRIGLILYHQKIGFKVNAMCVWKVPEPQIEQAGRYMADINSITHCYERLFTESFPYNLYAMVHAGDEETILSIFSEISADAGLTGGIILESVREYKKTSPKFFCEDR
jgi:DNA-binding Lrp family transcriptional regulator